MTRIMNFTAKPVRKQLRNRPKEKQKRANPHNFFIKSPQSLFQVCSNTFLILVYGKIAFCFRRKYEKKDFIFVVPISPKKGYTI